MKKKNGFEIKKINSNLKKIENEKKKGFSD